MPAIRNIYHLESEISRLSLLEAEQKKALGKRFSSPSAIFSTALSLFPKASAGLKSTGLFNQDFLGLLSRLVLPFTLNKTIFRKSNFIIKALVGLISQKASHYVSEENIAGVWNKVKSLFSKKDDKGKNLRGYGIPPM